MSNNKRTQEMLKSKCNSQNERIQELLSYNSVLVRHIIRLESENLKFKNENKSLFKSLYSLFK